MAGTGTFKEIIEGDVYKFYADGHWRLSSSGNISYVYNPTVAGKQAYKITACSKDEVNQAFQSAKAAQKIWAKTPLYKRAEMLHKVAEIMRKNKGPIAECLVKEVAKPAKDSVTEVVRSADLLSYTAEGIRILSEGKFLFSDSFPGNPRNKLCLASKAPLGVILAIPPFNYPVNLTCSKIGPALIAGNAVVVKPPTQGSVSTLHMMHCFHLAGFPKGLLSCVPIKASELGDYVTTHPLVNCISFTGGCDTGMSISKKAGMVPLQMELGGKDAMIVLEDGDIELAATNIIKGGFSFSGQRCTAVKVVLVMESVADKLVSSVNAKVAKLKVGPPENNCDIVPVVTEASANFIEGLVTDAKAKNAKLCQAKFSRQEWKRQGNLIWPLLIDNVTTDMRIAWEEPFGPVIPVMRIKTPEEGVKHCNSSKYGLQGCVFTSDINKAMLLSDAMESGTIQINSAPARGPDHFPFQGIRESGVGSQGVTNSINLMTKIKTTVLNLPTASYTMGTNKLPFSSLLSFLLSLVLGSGRRRVFADGEKRTSVW
ncbi:hypothetical protein SELMODRAFT_112240 [Selaginella moellendorffii]|uniref:NADP-dependent glyceraldehyde-3-phosphate dehydrogenase n=1 Tax=Selaginella moellendorffii TaxID=88036 RepID=D8SAN1_SELML|nr:hypothetical protein SELMODRAFT_112240 [Selaginella moellendorffii]